MSILLSFEHVVANVNINFNTQLLPGFCTQRTCLSCGRMSVAGDQEPEDLPRISAFQRYKKNKFHCGIWHVRFSGLNYISGDTPTSVREIRPVHIVCASSVHERARPLCVGARKPTKFYKNKILGARETI